jgi:excisionase family DNA binding protein
MTATQDAIQVLDPAQPDKWPKFMTVPETARILRVSKMTVYRMIHRDPPELISIRVGRSFRIRSDSLLKIVREGTDRLEEDA